MAAVILRQIIRRDVLMEVFHGRMDVDLFVNFTGDYAPEDRKDFVDENRHVYYVDVAHLVV